MPRRNLKKLAFKTNVSHILTPEPIKAHYGSTEPVCTVRDADDEMFNRIQSVHSRVVTYRTTKCQKDLQTLMCPVFVYVAYFTLNSMKTHIWPPSATTQSR